MIAEEEPLVRLGEGASDTEVQQGEGVGDTVQQSGGVGDTVQRLEGAGDTVQRLEGAGDTVGQQEEGAGDTASTGSEAEEEDGDERPEPVLELAPAPFLTGLGEGLEWVEAFEHSRTEGFTVCVCGTRSNARYTFTRHLQGAVDRGAPSCPLLPGGKVSPYQFPRLPN